MSATNGTGSTESKVGYCRPPLHSRFQPGVSGNPSGRPKDSKNLKTLLHAILNEQISLQDGSKSRKVSKAEAIMRRLIIGALKGDSRDLHALFRLAEQTGQFTEDEETAAVQVVRFSWLPEQAETRPASTSSIPAIRHMDRE